MPDAYQATAFFSATGSERHAGLLHVEATQIRFVQDENQLVLPFAGLTIRRGGAADRLIFFRHPEHPEVEVFTTDATVLQDPFLKQDAELEAQLKAMRRANLGAWAVVGAVLGLLLAGMIALIAFRGVAVEAAVAQIPASWEEKLGDQAFAQFSASNRIVQDSKLVGCVEALAAPLTETIGGDSQSFTFYIVDNPDLNAFALPGGIIAIHTGLLDTAEGPEEVLGVLAHEIAHVTRRHVLQNMVGSAGLFLIVQAFLGDTSGILAVLIDNSSVLFTRKFSRDFEREADTLGWQYLCDAGIDPRGMTRFFQRIHEQEQENSLGGVAESALALWSTHPITAERLDYLRAWEKRLNPAEEYRTLDTEWAALQQHLRTQLGTLDKGGK